MNRAENRTFFDMCCESNFLYCVKVLSVLFLLIILTANVAYASGHKNADSYKENSKLSGLLDQEQFQVGISCDEAMSIFKFDKKKGRGRWVTIKSSTVGFGKGKTLKTGFFRGDCRDNQLFEIEKIISINDELLDKEIVFKNFIKQFGEASSRIYPAYYLKYKGRYIEFGLRLRQKDNQTVIIYELEDMTAKVKK